MLDGGMVEFESQSLHVSLSSKFKCNSSLMASGWRENGFRPCIIHLTTELSLLPPSPPIKKKKSWEIMAHQQKFLNLKIKKTITTERSKNYAPVSFMQTSIRLSSLNVGFPLDSSVTLPHVPSSTINNNKSNC